MASSLFCIFCFASEQTRSFSEVFLARAGPFHRCNVGECIKDLSHLILLRKCSLKTSLYVLLGKVDLTFLRFYGEDRHM